MRKTALLLASAVAALATAGIAVAHYTTSGIAETSATFATTSKEAETRTCMSSDGSMYEITRGRYFGTSESATPALKGAFEAHVKAVVNTKTSRGWITGWIKVRSATDGEHSARAGFSATLGDGGSFDGFASGRAGHDAALFANVSGTFNKDTGFAAGSKIGGGATGNGLAILSGRICDGGRPGSAVKLELKGIVTMLEAGKIEVKPLEGSGSPQTCIITPGVSPAIPSGIVVNQTVVEIYCGMIGDKMTLLKLHVKETKPGSPRLEVKGIVEAVNTDPSEIIVRPMDGSASQKCAITPGVSPVIPAGLITSGKTKVAMYCATVGNPGVLTLLKLRVYES